MDENKIHGMPLDEKSNNVGHGFSKWGSDSNPQRTCTNVYMYMHMLYFSCVHFRWHVDASAFPHIQTMHSMCVLLNALFIVHVLPAIHVHENHKLPRPQTALRPRC